MKTLRSRVLVGTTVAVAAVLAVAGWTLFTQAERALVGEVDRRLEEQVRGLASGIFQSNNQLDLEFLDLDLEEFIDPDEGEFLQLWTEGQLLFSFPAVDEPLFEPEPTSEELVFEWIDFGAGARGRVLTLAFQPQWDEDDDDDDGEDEDEGEEDDGEYDPEDAEEVDLEPSEKQLADLVLVLAGEAHVVDQTLATLGTLLGSVGLLTLVSAGMVLVLVVRRSLRPVDAVADEVAAIGGESLSARLDASGVPGELLPIVQRVNELLERLEAAFERERSFSNDVAHELRTPLAGLRTTLEVTAKRPRSEAEYAEALLEGALIVGQLQSMVERLLQLARLDGGRAAIDSEPYVLGDVAVEAWEPFAAQAVARNLRVDLATNGFEVNAARELVEVILRNLYENAVTYADPGGEVRIETRRSHDGRIVLEVSNTGSQLSQEEAPSATQRFWRGDAARTEAGLHCGLGLSLVERAADALAGDVELRSRVDGEFAVVVRFPA